MADEDKEKAEKLAAAKKRVSRSLRKSRSCTDILAIVRAIEERAREERQERHQEEGEQSE